MCVVPASGEDEAGELLGSRNSIPVWAECLQTNLKHRMWTRGLGQGQNVHTGFALITNTKEEVTKQSSDESQDAAAPHSSPAG